MDDEEPSLVTGLGIAAGVEEMVVVYFHLAFFFFLGVNSDDVNNGVDIGLCGCV